ncbi:hypothetical protein L3Y34_000189 [Caenorhabditis briggsae]|uniref:Uncharacterized protein n=1 Tax=Caenorhabditis briggsae TaxID=6238 RepID=A0AAE9ILQ0_CAEBR|nr:hypothetical protein L3Y34_000189 [Caenorhabditis briggsae]
MDSFFAQLQLKTSQKKFYEQTWFLILVGAVLLLLILGIGAFFVIRSRKTKEPREKILRVKRQVPRRRRVINQVRMHSKIN